MTATCSHPDGCTRPHKGRGWCKPHLERIRKTGELGPADVGDRKPLGRPCSLADCDRPVWGDGGLDLCGMHYQRLKKHGDPTVVAKGGASLAHDLNPNWSGDLASYNAVHFRLRNDRGSARSHECIDCGSQAAHWSYDNLDPDDRIDETGCRYSTDPDHYDPRCVKCHSAFDRATRALLTGERP